MMLEKTTSSMISKSMKIPLSSTVSGRSVITVVKGAPLWVETGQAENRYQRREGPKDSLAILKPFPFPEPMTEPMQAACEPDETDRVAAAYRDHYRLLCRIAVDKFHVPAAEAENVVHDVFVKLLRYSENVRDHRAWLVAAVSNAARDYWRSPERRGDGADAPEIVFTPIDSIGASVDARSLMQELPERTRELLHLRYCDGLSAEELAGRLGTSVPYAKLLVHRGLVAARALLVSGRRRR